MENEGSHELVLDMLSQKLHRAITNSEVLHAMASLSRLQFITVETEEMLQLRKLVVLRNEAEQLAPQFLFYLFHFPR